METKRNDWKVLKLFTVAAVAAILSSGLSKAALVQTQAISAPTIEERLAKVREQLKHRGEPISSESNIGAPPQDNPATEKKETLLSQWPNWPNWANWSNWSNWGNWSDWPNWPNWANWGNF